MKALRLVLELHNTTNLSNRQISKTAGVSRPVVAGYFDTYRRSGIPYDELSKLTDTQVVDRLCGSGAHKDPRLASAIDFFPSMLTELPKVGVTRELLWHEYRKATRMATSTRSSATTCRGAL